MLCASVNSKYVWMWPLYATNLNDSRHVTKISMHHTVAALHAVDNVPFFAVVHTNADFSVFDDKGVLMTTIRPSIYSESGVAPSVINTAASSLWLEQQAPGVYKFLVASLTRVKRPNNSPPKRKNTRIHADAGESDLDINFYSVYYNTLNEKKTLGGQDQRSKNVLVPAHTCTATESGCIHVNHAIRELPDPQAQRNPKLLIVNDPPCILLSLGTNFLYKFGLRTTLYDTDLAFPSPSLDANRRPFQWNIGTKELNDDSFTAKETDIGHPTSGVDILGDDKVLTSGVASDSGTLSFVLSTVSVRYLARISRQTTKCFTNLRKDEDPVKLGCSVFVNQVSNIAVVFFGGEVRSSSLSANDSGSLAAILKDHGARAPSEGSCSTPVTGNINEILSTLASQDATPRKRRRRNSKDVGTGRETNSSKMLEGPQGYDARESWENAWKALSKSQDSLRERWESKSASQIVEDAGTLLSQRGNDSSPPIDEGPLRLLISSLNECLAQKSSRMRSVMETVIRQILDDRLIVGVSSGEKTLCARLPYLNSLDLLDKAVESVSQLPEDILVEYLQWTISNVGDIESEKLDSTKRKFGIANVDSEDVGVICLMTEALSKSWNDIELENSLRKVDVWIVVRLLSVLLFLLHKTYQHKVFAEDQSADDKQFILRVVQWMQIALDSQFASLLLNSSMDQRFLDVLQRYQHLVKEVVEATYHTCEVYGAIGHIINKAKLPVKPLPEYSIEMTVL
eukprot:gb/GECG01012962.1/.p1 GENE.gb/GECG01012962.1/~~gb/GECG01012962.1/.p1  ORF type:complete len:739 (+),score=80.72 gb/GECG01012962.1/:1-2217(+)